jgi:hypothetical protein
MVINIIKFEIVDVSEEGLEPSRYFQAMASKTIMYTNSITQTLLLHTMIICSSSRDTDFWFCIYFIT